MVEVVVGSPDLFHVVLRYVNRGGTDIWGSVSVMEDSRNFLCSNCESHYFPLLYLFRLSLHLLPVPNSQLHLLSDVLANIPQSGLAFDRLGCCGPSPPNLHQGLTTNTSTQAARIEFTQSPYSRSLT